MIRDALKSFKYEDLGDDRYMIPIPDAISLLNQSAFKGISWEKQ